MTFVVSFTMVIHYQFWSLCRGCPAIFQVTFLIPYTELEWSIGTVFMYASSIRNR